MSIEEAERFLAEALGPAFLDDPGTLPEIQLDGLSEDDAQRAFELLTGCGQLLSPQATAWDRDADEDVPVGTTPDVARLAAAGRLDLHVVLTGLRWGHAIPDLGVRVDPGVISLDYQPGSHWTIRAIAAFCRLLLGLADAMPHATLVVADPGGEPYGRTEQETFRNALAGFDAALREHGMLGGPHS